jgi:hypothetical protein
MIDIFPQSRETFAEHCRYIEHFAELVTVSEVTVNSVSKVINEAKQGKHIVGHNNYQVGKSILTEDAQGLLDAFHAGNVESTQVINSVKTRVDFGKPIGEIVRDNIPTPTTRGIIIDSKTGAHIVPSNPN